MTIEAHEVAHGQRKVKRKGTARDFLQVFAPGLLAQKGGDVVGGD